MKYFFNSFGAYIKYDTETNVYEVAKKTNSYSSFLRNDNPNAEEVVSQFSERQGFIIPEEEFNELKKEVLNNINK